MNNCRVKAVTMLSLLAVASGATYGCPGSEADTKDDSMQRRDAAALPEPDEDDAGAEPSALAATHGALVSIQDVSIANLPAAGHGLTVNALFTENVAPDYEEHPGELTGCKAWAYDLARKPPAPEQDHGTLHIEGLTNGPVRCQFDAQRGYVCPSASGRAQIVATSAAGPRASYAASGAMFAATDIGRYLQIGGAANPQNNGAFAITSVISASEVFVANPRAVAESFAASYTVLAGAGPTPGDLYSPFGQSAQIQIGLSPGGEQGFAFPDTALTPGEAFVMDEASLAKIQHIPVDGSDLTLSCASCGKAEVTIIRINTTDGNIAGASPVAMPRAERSFAEIQCVAIGADTITVPAGAMELIRASHAASPITRIRTAFMRDGFSLLSSAPPGPPNRVVLLSGHGMLGFAQP